MSFGFGFGFPRGGSAGAWSPFSLFANGGVQGAYYDPSYLNTYMSGLGPELVTNGGPFTTTTGWTATSSTLSVASGALRVTENGITANPYAQQSFAVTSGAWYKITFNLVTLNAAKIRVWVGSAYGSANWLTSPDIAALGPVTLYFLAAGPTAYFEFVGYCTAGGTSEYYDVNYVSVKEVTTIGNATMFTTSAGSTPVTAVEQNVGLILDQSQGGVGPELVTNGGFSTSANWTLSSTTITGGNLVFGVAFGYASQAISGTAGTYKLLVNKSVGFAGAGNLTFAFYNAGSIVGSAISIGSTTLTFGSGIITASGSFNEIRIVCSTTDAYQVDSVSLIRAPGNHAYVTADANRGILRSRFNQLTYSEQFDNAVWAKSNSFIQTNLLTYSELFENAAWAKNNSFVQTNYIPYSQEIDNVAWNKGNIITTGSWVNQLTAPDGTLTADLVRPTNVGTTHYAIATSSLPAVAGTYTCSLYVYAGSYTKFALRESVSTGAYVSFDIATASVIDSGNAGSVTISSSSITAVPGYPGWYRAVVTYVYSAGITPNLGYWALSPSYTTGQPASLNWAGDGTSGVYTWGAQLVQGSVPGDYQVTTSAAAAVAYANWDGTLTARKVSEDAANTQHSMTQLATVTTDVHNLSFYAKAGERRRFTLRFGNIAPPDNATFDLVSGTVVTSTPASIATISLLTNGWYRCSVFSTSSSAGIRSHQLYINSDSGSGAETYAGDGTSGIYISDSQLAQGSAPGNYRATTASALPILYTNPFGGLTAMKLGENTAVSSRHAMYQNSGITLQLPFLASVYLKADSRTYALIGLGNSRYTSCIVNLTTGVAGAFTGPEANNISATTFNVGSGWWRVVIAGTYSGVDTGYLWVGVSDGNEYYTGDGSSGIYVLGGQFVQTNVFPTNTYQRIAAATDYATGPAFPLYIQTDGSNDAMLTNTINFANGPSSPPLGPELVTNGDFSAGSTGWTLPSGWAISGGAAVATAVTSGANLESIGQCVAGRWYYATITVSSFTAGGVSFATNGAATGQIFTAAGTYTQYFLAPTTGYINLIRRISDFTGTIDNISVKEMDSAYAPDKMTVTAGVTKLSDAALGMVTELSANLSLNNGSFWCLAPLTTGASADFDISFKGTNQVQVNSGIKLSPVTAVITGASSISTPSAEFIYNGTRTELDTGSQGTGTYGNYPLYLFARGNASLYFTGYFYGAVVVQKFLSAGELASLTNWMEVRTFGKDMSYSYDYVTLDNGDSVTLDNGDPVYTNIYYS